MLPSCSSWSSRNHQNWGEEGDGDLAAEVNQTCIDLRISYCIWSSGESQHCLCLLKNPEVRARILCHQINQAGAWTKPIQTFHGVPTPNRVAAPNWLLGNYILPKNILENKRSHPKKFVFMHIYTQTSSIPCSRCAQGSGNHEKLGKTFPSQTPDL